MKFCIYGAGAIGCTLAARLANAGNPTTVIARGATLAALRKGIVLEAKGLRIEARPAVTDDPSTLGPQDVVITAVKAHDLPGLAPAIATLLHDRTVVIHAQNGIPWWYFYRSGDRFDGRRIERLDPGGVLWDRIGAARTIGCAVNFGANIVGPGVVRQGDNNGLAIGEPDGQPSTRLAAIAQALGAAGFEVAANAPVRVEVWKKLRWSIVSSSITALTHMTSGGGSRSAVLRPIYLAAMAEATAIAAAFGVTLDRDYEARVQQFVASTHKPSMLQDLEAGRMMEIDAQLTVPVEMAHMADIAVPTLEVLVALVRERGREAGLYRG